MKQRPQKFKGKNRDKVSLVFDESKRKQFLGGFHKRKVLRQKKAQEELKEQLKNERKRIKENAQEKLKKMVSYRVAPEIEKFNCQEFELAGRKISILEQNFEHFEQDFANVEEKTNESEVSQKSSQEKKKPIKSKKSKIKSYKRKLKYRNQKDKHKKSNNIMHIKNSKKKLIKK